MKLKTKMKMKKKGGQFFFHHWYSFPKIQAVEQLLLPASTSGRKKKQQTNNRRRGRTKEQKNEEQKTKLFCGPESIRALTNKLLKTLLSRTGDGKEKNSGRCFHIKRLFEKQNM